MQIRESRRADTSVLKHLPNSGSPKISVQLINPVGTIELYSLSYCGVNLQRQLNKHPQSLWKCVNYVMPCSILYNLTEICWDCVAALDKIRDKQGYKPVIDELQNPTDCKCAVWRLMRQGCQCK